MKEMKEKILAWLKTNPPIAERRTAWTIRMALSLTEDPEDVHQACDQLVLEGLIRHTISKNMHYQVVLPVICG